MSQPLALIVDDEADICELLQITLSRMGITSQTAESLSAARQLLDQYSFDLCITDMNLPDGNGLDLVEQIQHQYTNLPIAVITAHGNAESAVRALKNGAFDFLSKPVDLHILRKLILSALNLNLHTDQERRSRHQLLGDSKPMREIRSMIAKLARNQAPIYISGESGTGKELVARLIHAKSPRAEQPFIAVNCGAIPHELMESEFFGHKKGSFSGAVADKIGLFQAAEGGTLFLDEVADLPFALQVKLLRAIQEKSVRPVGGQHEIQVDIRILSATHKDLAQMVSDGQFRQDLFYRINVIELTVPPLRERTGDISMLSEHILSHLAGQNNTPLAHLTEAAMTTLQKHPFPGNVRELENTLERATALCEQNLIQSSDLNLPEIQQSSLYQSATLLAEEQAETPISLERYMDEVEKQAIMSALEQTRWNKTAAAKQLGISFRALRYRLKKLELE